MAKETHLNAFIARNLPHLVAALVLATSLFSGCNCKEKATLNQQPEWACVEDDTVNGRPAPGTEACPNGGRFVKGSCMEERCDAGDLAPNCCPGTYCTAGGVCELPLGLLTNCEQDSDCEGGQYCLDRSTVSANFSEMKVCGFIPVDASGACPEGLSAFNQRCVRSAPCTGTCSEGSVCNIDTNNCETAPTTAAADATCSQSCGENQILVFSDPNNMIFHSCCAISCECVDLPPLQPGPFGRYSDMAVYNNQLLVSGYDSDYGDLALATYELDGTQSAIEYIDGLPASGTPVGAPDGPRQGISTPGPDIGTHTAMEMLDSRPLIVYRDEDQKNLKFAIANASGDGWTIDHIDTGADGNTDDIGQYTSMVVDSTGLAHVSYYTHRYTVDGTVFSGLRYARAKSSTPSSSDDWDTTTLASVQSCGTPCAENAACVADGSSAACATMSTACASPCQCGEECVEQNGSPVCATKQPEFLDVPCDGSCTSAQSCVEDGANGASCLTISESCATTCAENESCVDDGTSNLVCRLNAVEASSGGLAYGYGLFSQIAILEETPVVVFYDNTSKTLQAAYANFSGSGDMSAGFSVQGIGCGDTGATGYHPNIATNGSDFAITYQGSSGETLELYQGSGLNNLFAGTAQTIDEGARTSQQILVGAYSNPIYLNNQLYILYADQTNNDIVLIKKDGDTWTPTSIATQGALGSYINVQSHNNQLYTSTYKRYFTDTGVDLSSISIFANDPTSISNP